jgi:hypothetical protein
VLTVTAGDIITQARSAADAETATPTTDFVKDAELLLVLTRAYRELVDIIVSEDGGLELLATSATLTSPYNLPSDFYRHIAAEIPGDPGGNPWKPLKQFSFRQRNDYSDTAWPRYRIVGNALALAPSTAAPTSVRLWYVAFPSALASSSDVTKSVNGWDDFLIYTLAAYICRKEDRDEQGHQASRGEALGRIRAACKDIAIGDTTTIADVESQPEEYFDMLV